MIFSGKTDIGKRRSSNQDSFRITPLPEGFWLCTVCDGMGGENGGNIASSVAVSAFTEEVILHFDASPDKAASLLTEGVAAANRAVFTRASEDPALNGMGTTLVALLTDSDGNATVVNVGDSRMYYKCGEDFRQITRDHSYVQYLVDRGEITLQEAERAPMKNIIIRAVGHNEEVTPDIFSLKLCKGGYILLCSDGLTNFVSKDTLCGELHAEDGEALSLCADRLVRLANEGGGADNITVILGKID